MRARATVVGLVATLAAVAAASGVPVDLNDRTDVVHAERLALPLRFEIVATEIAPFPPPSFVGSPAGAAPMAVPCGGDPSACPAPPVPCALAAVPPSAPDPARPCVAPPACGGAPSLDAAGGARWPASGTASCPAELSEVLTPAWTNATVGNWSYAVTLRERSPAAVGMESVYEVALSLDERPMGVVVVSQAVDDPLVREGARVAFDIGPTAPEAPLLVVTVRLPPAAGCVVLKAISDVDLAYKWRGASGDMAGKINPTLAGVAHEPMCIRIVHDDSTGGTHNLQIKDSGGQIVANPTPNIDPSHREEVLEWTPPATGTYRYECKFHRDTQFGSIQVS